MAQTYFVMLFLFSFLPPLVLELLKCHMRQRKKKEKNTNTKSLEMQHVYVSEKRKSWRANSVFYFLFKTERAEFNLKYKVTKG